MAGAPRRGDFEGVGRVAHHVGFVERLGDVARVFGHVIQRDAAISIQRDDHHRATPAGRKVTYSTSTPLGETIGATSSATCVSRTSAMSASLPTSQITRARSLRFMIDRRRVLQLGALAALTTTVLPACGTDEQGQPAPQPTPDPSRPTNWP